MKRLLSATILSLVTAITAFSANVTFGGCSYPAIQETVNASSGLDALYVLYNTDGVTVTVDGLNATSPIRWKKWGYMGASYGEDIDPSLYTSTSTSTTLTAIEGDCGYSVEYGADTYYLWIVDYSKHPFEVNGLTLSDEQDCGTTNLNFDGKADRITYYTITARSTELDRDITLSYRNLQRDEENVTYHQVDVTDHLASISSVIHVDAPLCDTDFEIEGDKFLRAWNMPQSFSTTTIPATAVDVITVAQQTAETPAENQIVVESTSLGGSAPVEITFRSAVSDAAIFHEWQMSHDIEFVDIFYRNRELDFTYTFNEMGNFYVRLIAANANGSCETQNDAYNISISESALLCPNAFSPGASEGVNDEWRVSYKSIVSFECYIFDRWGTKMTEFHDPAQGWDGKYRGKLVPAGVYYYVIKAKGSDGKKYDLSGDINILKSNK